MPGHRARTPGDGVTASVGRASRRASPTGTAVPAGGDPRWHPRCKRSVALSGRLGGLTGRGCQGPRELSQKRAVVSARRGCATAVGVALSGNAMGTTGSRARSVVHPGAHGVGIAPDSRPSCLNRGSTWRIAGLRSWGFCRTRMRPPPIDGLLVSASVMRGCSMGGSVPQQRSRSPSSMARVTAADLLETPSLR